jgi:hypothetical protein
MMDHRNGMPSPAGQAICGTEDYHAGSWIATANGDRRITSLVCSDLYLYVAALTLTLHDLRLLLAWMEQTSPREAWSGFPAIRGVRGGFMQGIPIRHALSALRREVTAVEASCGWSAIPAAAFDAVELQMASPPDSEDVWLRCDHFAIALIGPPTQRGRPESMVIERATLMIGLMAYVPDEEVPAVFQDLLTSDPDQALACLKSGVRVTYVGEPRQLRHLMPPAYVRALLACGDSPAAMEAAVIVLEDKGCSYIPDLTPTDLVAVLEHPEREVRQRAILLAGTIGRGPSPHHWSIAHRSTIRLRGGRS